MTEQKKQEKILETAIGQKAILFDPRTNKYLLVKARAGKFVEEMGAWEFVGGRIHEGESTVDALAREIAEEIGGSVDYGITGIVAMRDPYATKRGTTLTLVGYLMYYAGGDIVLSDEHEDHRWQTAEEIAQRAEYKQWVKDFVAQADATVERIGALEGWRRCMADFDNYKKRQQQSQKELAGYLIEKMVLDVVPVMDNFRSATAHVPEQQKNSPWVVGIQYIEKQLEKILEENGVRMISAQEGDTFDPKIHEAVSSGQGTEDNEQRTGNSEQETRHKNQVVEKIVQRGYMLGERVIRPVKVIVK
ncbi:nucleotide exchange factor GrpE [Candidatus Peribacteria bacterium RIFCSPHIGHO2_02_FULL_52_16]|nr:MAG: nucleotide exchange factor GrpE [Candidatus Peribacteria bacterium RIFCSPHIGHO2_02_FULL_52_16]HLB51143.1 nucleotide exchange factor GrpE [Patescibacteria group bacterium]